MKLKFLFSFMVISLSANSALAATCSVFDPTWQTGHNKAQVELHQAVDNMASTISRESQITNEKVIQALQVATRQRSVNAQRQTLGHARFGEATAQVYADQHTAESIVQAYRNYGPQGQAVGACEMIELLDRANGSIEARLERVRQILDSGGIDTVPGQVVPPMEAAARRLQFDKPEAVSAVSFFAKETSSAMKDAYMNNVIGTPIYVSDQQGPTRDLQFINARRIEALRSPAIVSLATVRASTEDAGTGGMSYVDGLDFFIKQYGGGPEYENWSAALTSKSKTGLTKELARLRAINLQLSKKRQDGADRIQAIIAVLLGGAATQ